MIDLSIEKWNQPTKEKTVNHYFIFFYDKIVHVIVEVAQMAIRQKCCGKDATAKVPRTIFFGAAVNEMIIWEDGSLAETWKEPGMWRCEKRISGQRGQLVQMP